MCGLGVYGFPLCILWYKPVTLHPLCGLVDIHYEWRNLYISYVHSTFIIQDGFSPLYVASGYGHTDVVDILLRKGADVNQTTTNEVQYVLQ